MVRRLRASARLGRQALVTADRFGITDATDLGWVRMALASVYGEWDRSTLKVFQVARGPVA